MTFTRMPAGNRGNVRPDRPDGEPQVWRIGESIKTHSVVDNYRASGLHEQTLREQKLLRWGRFQGFAPGWEQGLRPLEVVYLGIGAI